MLMPPPDPLSLGIFHPELGFGTIEQQFNKSGEFGLESPFTLENAVGAKLQTNPTEKLHELCNWI